MVQQHQQQEEGDQEGHTMMRAAEVAVKGPEGYSTWGTQKVLEDKYLSQYYHLNDNRVCASQSDCIARH